MSNALLPLEWVVKRLNTNYEWWGAGFYETEYKGTNTFFTLVLWTSAWAEQIHSFLVNQDEKVNCIFLQFR